MNKSRLKYYATAECVKNLAEKYIDDDSEMDLEALCKKKKPQIISYDRRRTFKAESSHNYLY